MRITDFDVYHNLLKEKSGLDLSPDNSSLIESRLSPVAKKWGYVSLEAMTIALQGVPDKNLVNDVVEAMTTGDTSFYRDTKPFDYLRETAIPYLIKKRAAQKKIRIWCAGCSTGQEPYSVALMLKEKGIPPGWKVELIATDISNEALDQARNAVYSQFEVQRGLGVRILLKYFDNTGGKWKAQEALRKMVKFEQFNMLDDMKKLGLFDIILCRNVISYFDDKTKSKTLDKLAAQLHRDGFLVLGKSEKAVGLTEEFKSLSDVPGLNVFNDSMHLAGH